MGVKSDIDYFRDWEAHVFGYGYGSGEEHVMPALREFFACIGERSHHAHAYDYKVMEERLGAPVAWLLINALCHAGAIEYGSSPRFGWLTTQGESLRQFVDGKSAKDLIALTQCNGDYAHCYPDACNCGPNGYERGRKCGNPFWIER